MRSLLLTLVLKSEIWVLLRLFKIWQPKLPRLLKLLQLLKVWKLSSNLTNKSYNLSKSPIITCKLKLAILQAMETKSQQNTLNWTPLILAVATAIPIVKGYPCYTCYFCNSRTINSNSNPCSACFYYNRSYYPF
jgi:hypothetical protein